MQVGQTTGLLGSAAHERVENLLVQSGGVREGRATLDSVHQALTINELNWGGLIWRHTIDAAQFAILLRPRPTTTALFIVRDTFLAEAENRWLDVLYSMSYEQRPYPLTRATYVPSVSARDFPSEEAPGRDVVDMLREEIEELASEGVALIQRDEPVLSVNPRTSQVECSSAIGATFERATHQYAADKIWVNPDCGFGRFSDRPVAAAKLRAIVEAVAVRQAPRRA